MQEIKITRPDDWHVHLRDGTALADTVAHSARYFGRAIVMPNLVPPVTTTQAALDYRRRILDNLDDTSAFQPLMTLYLTDATEPGEIDKALDSGHVYAAKLYPAGATTHSDAGVTDVEKIYPCLERMSERGMPLLVHGEATDPDIDIFDREQAFIDRTLGGIVERFPQLKVVMEHITTRQAVEFVKAGPETLGATITPQHLLFNRNHLLAGGIRPHYYCLPILKRSVHQQALLDVIAGGNPRFFLGTDSAPHPVSAKENACGCAGCYSAHAALELYAQVFDALDALDKLEGFASFHGPDFYGLPRNTDTVTLRRQAWQVPHSYKLGPQQVFPLLSEQELQWSVAGD